MIAADGCDQHPDVVSYRRIERERRIDVDNSDNFASKSDWAQLLRYMAQG